MKKQSNNLLSRRRFLGSTAAAAATVSVVPLSSQCVSAPVPLATGTGIPNSNFGGVQIGTITYSFRGINVVEEIVQACVKSGASSIELMSSGIEQWCGAPEEVRAPRRPRMRRPEPEPDSTATGGGPGAAPGGTPQGPPPNFPGFQQEELSEEELAEREKAAAESREAIREWRLSNPMGKYEELRKLFNDAGVNIHIVKFQPSSWSEEEIEYAFEAAKTLGAQAVSEELGDDAARILGPIAEKHGMYAAFHNHYQYAEEDFSPDPFLAYSPANMLNFDCGHYFGSTGLDPVEFIEKYNDRIFSIHLKDKTGPETDVENGNNNQNQVWGQGETPLAEVLLTVKEKYPHIHCDVELEYRVPMWSSSEDEVRKCVNYCRNILI